MSSPLKHYKLGELCQVKHGWPFQGEYFSDEGELVVLTPANFFEEGGFKRVAGKEKYYLGDFPKEYLCSKGDLVVAMTQQAEGLLGSTALVPEDGVYLHNQRIGLITHNEELVDKQFLYYLFMTAGVRKQIRNSASGTKVKHTSPEKIYDVDVEIPDINSQKKIAGFLMSLERKVDLNEKSTTKIEQIVSSLYDYWFLQGEYPNKDGKPYKSSGGEMIWCEELKRDIPKGWSIGRIEDLGTIVSGGTPSTAREDYYTDNGIAWITPNDLSYQENLMYVAHGDRDITEDGLNNSSATLMPANSILFSTRAPIGYIAIAMNEVSTNQGFKSIVPNKGYGQYFIYYTIKRNTKIIAQQGAGTTFKEVSKETFSKIRVLLPPKEIVKLFEEMVDNLCAFRAVCEEENRKLKSCKQWLLPLLMNGQATIKQETTK